MAVRQAASGGVSWFETVAMWVELPVLLLVSVAVQVTVVGPLAKVLPLAGRQLTVRPVSQLSVAIGRASGRKRVHVSVGAVSVKKTWEPPSAGRLFSDVVDAEGDR